MNTSIVAIISDVIRNGRPLIGYAFNSFGRYGCGALLRERFIPKILDAPPESLLNDSQDNFDAQKIMNCLLARERAGGHAERSIPLGTVEVAVWDLIAKIQDRPLYLTLADFFNNGKSLAKVPCYVGGGWYFPGQTSNDLRQEMLKYLDDGYEMVKMKIGGLTMSEDVSRVETVLSVVSGGNNLAVDATCGFDRNRALAYAQALKQFELRWYEEPCDPQNNNDEKYYPVKDLDGINRDLYNKYKEIKNDKVKFIGRLGLYSYLDMDQCINISLQTAKNILNNY
jgi:hypothetical protein